MNTKNIQICANCPRRQRGSGRLICLESNKPFLDHAESNQCPLEYFNLSGEALERFIMPRLTPRSEWGPTLWGEIHRRPYVIADLSGELQWLTTVVTSRLPCGECQRDWASMLAAHPPNLTSPDDYFASLVEHHNVVNRKLGKPLMSLNDAYAKYRP